MPTYEYECKACRHSFDFFQSMKDEPLADCPNCGKKLRRLINGGTGVIFKGGGFYATDKAAGNGKAGAQDKPKSDAAPCQGCPAAGSGAKPGACPKATGA
jgi:putative FmdB family regulatory protein